MTGSPDPRRVRQLLVVAVLVSVVHYLDNVVRWDDFLPARPETATFRFIELVTVPVGWLVFTACAVAADRALRHGRWAHAAAWLGADAGSGLVGFAHYVDISPSQLSTFQNAHVMTDIALGVTLVVTAIWMAVRPPTTLVGGATARREADPHG